jgi:hypothetical protein
MMGLRVLSGAALLALANGQCNVQTEYQCKTQTKCINWDQFNDGITDCTQAEDEAGAHIDYCPGRKGDTGAVAYLSFRTDPGKDYSTLAYQPQNALGTTSPDGTGESRVAPGASPCVFPFNFDSNGDGVVEEYTACTRVCTDGAVLNSIPAAVRMLNPDNSFLTNTKQGCKERSTPGKAPQVSRAWCATSVDAQTKRPLTASFCTESCGMGNTGQMALTDDFGQECNPFMAMPPLEIRLSEGSGSQDLYKNWQQARKPLEWTFNTDLICKLPGKPGYGQADTDPQTQERYPCGDEYGVNSQNFESNPLASDLKYHLRRVLQTGTTSFSITVYHEDSPMRAQHKSCYLGNPTCCEFTIRIVDAEDPALLYPPFGPEQSITRCKDVQTCSKCQWEVAKPSSSSDRVCKDWSQCDKCSYVQNGQDGNALADRRCTPLTLCLARQGKYMVKRFSGLRKGTQDGCDELPYYQKDVTCADISTF